MKRGLWIALVLASCSVAVPRLLAQAPAGGDATGSAQHQPGNDAQKPAAVTPQSGANPFPEDTSTIPVMPSKATPIEPNETDSGSINIPPPGEDTDPSRSPDDPVRTVDSRQDVGSSSSLTDLDRLLPQPEDDQPGQKKRKVKEPTHQETSAEDISVGGYYLDKKNWKAALSRFQSAMVLDPENPAVYWGLAEAERHLGNFADARAYYLKVVDYDPDSRHGKDAQKALKEPEIANAQNHVPSQPAVETPKQ